jgi:hypothetical protein
MKKEVTLKTNYSCPYCESYLRIWNNIIFTVRFANGTKQGILLLNPHLGDYTCTMHTELDIQEGELIDFFCPVCDKSLSAHDINDKLVRVIMTDEENKQFDVYFSRVAGEESTFKISDNNIIAKYGKDDSHYLNYFVSKLKENT